MIIKKSKGFNIEKFREFPITYTLIGINIIIFALVQFFFQGDHYIFERFGLNGYLVFFKGEWYRLFTSIFLHWDMMHIVMNMLSIYMVGTMVERLFSIRGYLSIYFVSALFGSFASMYMHKEGLSAGASGAIFGVFGALAGFAWMHRSTMQQQFMEFMRSFGMILLLNLGIGLIFPSIDMSAHIGGLIAGLLGGLMLAKGLKYLSLYLLIVSVFSVFIYDYLSALYVV